MTMGRTNGMNTCVNQKNKPQPSGKDSDLGSAMAKTAICRFRILLSVISIKIKAGLRDAWAFAEI